MKTSKMQSHKELLFSTPLYIFDYEDAEILKQPLDYVLNKSRRLFVSETCRSTEDHLHTLPEFSSLVFDLKQKIKEVFDDIGLLREDEIITCMWANVSKKLNRHNMHLHPNSFFSAVLYLSAPENCGNIGFKDPRFGAEMLSFDFAENSIFKHRTIEVEPITGRLIFFPSWLYHGTRQGEFGNNENRVSLSFNIMPKTNVTDYGRKCFFTK
jgi:uncharacterized protein (TIGR02466 family)